MVSLFAAIALLISPFGTGKRQRALGALPLLGLLFDPVIHLMLTGSTTSNTTAVKWLPANPYYGFRELWDTVGTASSGARCFCPGEPCLLHCWPWAPFP